MNILIPAIKDDCIAAKALRAEGLEPTVEIIKGPKGYSDIFGKWWRAQEGFIVVEHDIVPWPGALQKLWDCPESWCGHSYPLHGQGLFGGYLGCTKFSRDLTVKHPKLVQWVWQTRWQDIDGIMLMKLQEITGQEHFHLHFPPVGHVRELPRAEDLRHPPTHTLPGEK
jgi:hypothetical protein